MHPNLNKRQAQELLEKGEKIGKLLGLDRVATFNMAWKEPRLDLPGGGECYPLIDVLEKLAEKVSAPKKSGGRSKKVKPVRETGTNEA